MTWCFGKKYIETTREKDEIATSYLLKHLSPYFAENNYLLFILQDPLRFILAAGTGTLFLVSLIVLRIYLVRIFNCIYNLNVPAFLEVQLKMCLLNEYRGKVKMSLTYIYIYARDDENKLIHCRKVLLEMNGFTDFAQNIRISLFSCKDLSNSIVKVKKEQK